MRPPTVRRNARCSVARNVDELAEVFQGLIKIGPADTDALGRRRIMGVMQVFERRRSFGIAHAGQTVVEHGHGHQDHGIEHHRLEQMIAQ